MGKIKTEAISNTENNIDTANITVKEEESYEDKLQYVNSIAKPIATKKMAKKCYKLIKKAMKHKSFIRNGLKDVQTRLRKGETGIVILAGNVTPIDIMCHLPAVCEEKGIPYIYTPSRADLGAAMNVKRGTIALLIRENPDYKDLYDELKTEISHLNIML